MIRLALRVPRAHAELVLADLLELAPTGVEEVELAPAAGADGGEELVEYAVYGAPGELPELPDLRALAGGVAVELSSRELPDDWSERWKRFHRPVLVQAPDASVPSLHVRPPWEARLERADVCDIAIDPAQAFGTGAHATTRLCLELLLALAAAEPARGPVLDVGAGSGVLAIAAAKLGYRPVIALDNDPLSVAAIADNATAETVRVESRLFDLRCQRLPASCQGGRPLGETVVLANLLRPLLLELADSIERPPAHLIASGLLRDEADEIADAFAQRFSLRERERRQRGEWAALWLTRS